MSPPFDVLDLFSMPVGVSASAPAPHDDFWYNAIGFAPSSGERVTDDTAMQVSTVYACIRRIASTLSTLPLKVYERRPDGGKSEKPTHPLYEVLHDQPNPWQTSDQWIASMQACLELRGWAFSRKIPGSRGMVDQLWPIHPDCVTVERMADGKFRFTVRNETGRNEVLLQDEMFFLQGLSFDGITPLSPIGLAAQQIGTALAQGKFQGRFYAGNITPSVALKVPSDKTWEDRTQLEQAYVAKYGPGGSGAGGPMILPPGMEVETLGMKLEDAQFLQSMQFGVEDIARIFDVPLHLIGHLEGSKFSANVEALSIDFVRYSLRPRARVWRSAIRRDLILAPQRFFAEFDLQGLLQGDSNARQQFYHGGINDGWMTRNEARLKENLNPLPGLDTPLQPQNMGPAGADGQDGGQSERERALEAAARAHLETKEANAFARAAKQGKLDEAWAREWFAEHEGMVREKLAVGAEEAVLYCAERLAARLGAMNGKATAEEDGERP